MSARTSGGASLGKPPQRGLSTRSRHDDSSISLNLVSAPSISPWPSKSEPLLSRQSSHAQAVPNADAMCRIAEAIAEVIDLKKGIEPPNICSCFFGVFGTVRLSVRRRKPDVEDDKVGISAEGALQRPDGVVVLPFEIVGEPRCTSPLGPKFGLKRRAVSMASIAASGWPS